MCGRLTQPTQSEISRAFLEALGTDLTMGKYAPSPSGKWFDQTRYGQRIAVVVRLEDGSSELPVLTQMRWGYAGADRTIYNSRLEGITNKSMWREDFRHRRCIIPISTFIEGGASFANADDGPLLCAGIFTRDSHADGSGSWRDVSLVTVAGRGVVQVHHDRQPAVLPADMIDKWLDRTSILSEEDRLEISRYKPHLQVAGTA